MGKGYFLWIAFTLNLQCIMLSSDKNIEYIGEFVEELKHWFSLKSEYTKLNIIDKVVRICTVLILVMFITLLLGMMLIYLSFAAAYALETIVGSLALGFLSVSGVYLLVLMLVVLKRHSWIERPIVRFLVSILTDNAFNK